MKQCCGSQLLNTSTLAWFRRYAWFIQAVGLEQYICVCVVRVLAKQEGVTEVVLEADEDEAVLPAGKHGYLGFVINVCMHPWVCSSVP